MMEFKNTVSQAALRELWQEAFGDSDKFLDAFFSSAYSNQNSITAFINNELAGALYWFECELNGKKTAYIYAVATAKRHRGKGVCAALMAHTHLYLRDNGYSLAILVPSDPSLFDFYRKQGYETCGYISDFKVQAEDREIHLKKFSATEYFNIRNTFTPQNSVNLIGYTDFLNSQYAFYKGDDFIFCKNKSGSSFPEFLGNTEKLPFIIFSLGHRSARIRTVGNKKPFCMGISLDGTRIESDIYFPFAFD